ncbi:MAG: nucleotidyltransferase domain-containing protein [Pseudomonadota bacterium]|uniref:Nucleotidyltransferase domain-containing protein n=1 Tax=Candidatus Desulfatibia profunda TaxID=2841695 RepID=A0A8J6NKX5_9BACT|nr:nucleotidyltransferase domain-containing protein [Candidatus Desulfatibia profunda]MBL7180624.1 nucleotidyltransferase domain-containing protein [Desulfobacterales bacterium]
MNNSPIERGAQKTGLVPDSDQARWAIGEIKAILYSYMKWVHSLVMFGSYARGQAGHYSDVDFLVLLKKGEQLRKIKRILFDFTLKLNRKNTDPVKIQIVSFDEKQIEYLFELATPLAHAARHGVVIWDDGWFKTLLSRPYPKWPTREGAVEAFTRWIVWMYFRCAIDLKREMLRDHGPEGLCTQEKKCMGHFSGDILARVISRMLYVTLPARGFLPLTKPEAIKMALEAYGRSACRPVALAMNVLRKERGISYHEFQVLFPFARRLFRECVRACGPKNPKVIEALWSNANIYKYLRKGG